MTKPTDGNIVPLSRLKAFSSPITDDAAANEKYDLEEYGDRLNSFPKLQRHEEPTLLEIFYDLFFSATYNAYCDAKQVTNHATLKASIGYFSLLWLTWFVVTLFDVRYATDSIFARLYTAIQLGVLIGFVVVAPKFNPFDQETSTMQRMSLILAVSRAVLAMQYGWMAWHVRRWRKTRWPLCIHCAMHTAAALVYLGITFRFHDGKSSRVFVTWYAIAAVEAVISLVLSHASPILALGDTHIMKRLALLTVLILGEGIESVAKKVLLIVTADGSWDATTIGHVTASAATIYFVFLVYFDWLGVTMHLPPIRRDFWVIIHFPFHQALVLFMQGFCQLLVWGKIVTALKRALDIADPTDDVNISVADNVTTASLVTGLNATVQGLLSDYPPKILSTQDTVNLALKNISSIPDSFWTDLRQNKTWTAADDSAFEKLSSAAETLGAAMINAVFGAFGYDLQGEVSAKTPRSPSGFQLEVNDKNWSRYGLVFAYTYIAAGCTILLVLVIRLLSVRGGWSFVQPALVLMLALGTGLTSILWFNSEWKYEFLTSSWVAPLIAIVWSIIVVVTHINFGGINLKPLLPKCMRSKQS